jgi:hypothetical protein
VVLWSRLAFDLRPYLTERGAEEAVLIGFFHRELADVAGALYLEGGRAARYHGKLADYFRPGPGEDGRPRWAGASLHALGELPYQLAKAGEDRWEELEDTLTDFGFLETKASRVDVQRDENGQARTYGGAYFLQDDFDLALREISGGDAADRPAIIVTATDFGARGGFLFSDEPFHGGQRVRVQSGGDQPGVQGVGLDGPTSVDASAGSGSYPFDVALWRNSTTSPSRMM